MHHLPTTARHRRVAAAVAVGVLLSMGTLTPAHADEGAETPTDPTTEVIAPAPETPAAPEASVPAEEPAPAVQAAPKDTAPEVAAPEVAAPETPVVDPATPAVEKPAKAAPKPAAAQATDLDPIAAAYGPYSSVRFVGHNKLQQMAWYTDSHGIEWSCGVPGYGDVAPNGGIAYPEKMTVGSGRTEKEWKVLVDGDGNGIVKNGTTTDGAPALVLSPCETSGGKLPSEIVDYTLFGIETGEGGITDREKITGNVPLASGGSWSCVDGDIAGWSRPGYPTFTARENWKPKNQATGEADLLLNGEPFLAVSSMRRGPYTSVLDNPCRKGPKIVNEIALHYGPYSVVSSAVVPGAVRIDGQHTDAFGLTWNCDNGVPVLPKRDAVMIPVSDAHNAPVPQLPEIPNPCTKLTVSGDIGSGAPLLGLSGIALLGAAVVTRRLTRRP